MHKAALPILVSAVSLLLGGCAVMNERPEPKNTIRDQYNNGYQEGSRNTVRLLRDALRARRSYGHTDPYTPMREPDVVMPIWVVPHRDERTDGRRRVSGHWEHAVVRHSDWVTE